MRFLRSKNLVVVGNGATSVDASGQGYTNRQALYFLQALRDSGYRIDFVQPQRALAANRNIHDERIASEAIRSRTVRKFDPLGLGSVLLRLLASRLVYIFFPGTLPRLIARLCLLLRLPYAIYLRGEQFSTEGSDARILAKASFICSVVGLCEKVEKLNARVLPIRPMLDLESADSYRRSFAADRQPGDPWRLLFVGRLEAAKGVPELVEALRLLRAEGFPVELSLVGGGELYTALAESPEARSGALRLTGLIDNKRQLHAEYERADFFVLPSHHEGFPRVLFEAMVKSMVIFTSFVGGIPALMKDGENCLRIPIRDARAIADAIVGASQDAELLSRLAGAGHDTAFKVLREYPQHVDALLAGLNKEA